VDYDELVGELNRSELDRFYGKYRAVVVDNLDPEQADRIQVRVPEIFGDGDVAAWAVPSWPPGSTPEQRRVPEVGAEVWVEFEAGDPSRPIWDGLLY
jgi:hypothetical protein